MSDDVTAKRLGVIHEPPFVTLPVPAAMFRRRAARMRFLATESRVGPYLRFLSEIVACQEALASELPAPAPVEAAVVARAREAHMPPIDRPALAGAPELLATFDRLLDRTAAVAMPDAARDTREALAAADDGTRGWLLEQVLGGDVAPEDAGPAVFAGAAVQVHAARLAAGLPADGLVPVRVGACPCCGGRPAVSIVVGDKQAEGARYAVCSTCGTLWNEVRVKCLACGTTKGIGYRSLGEEAVIKAEVCDGCGAWTKILYGLKDPALEPVADDLASLGLDALMRDTAWRRAGFNPFMVGV